MQHSTVFIILIAAAMHASWNDLFLPTGEMCAPLMTLRSKWLDANTLLLVELNSHDDITPPRTFLYKVKSVQGQRVVLTEIWTGWGDVADQDQVYFLEAH